MAEDARAAAAKHLPQPGQLKGSSGNGISFGVRRYASSGPRRLFMPRELPFVPTAENDPPRNLGRMLFAHL